MADPTPLYDAVCSLIGGLDGFAWAPGGVYPAGVVGVFTRRTPADPDQVVTVTVTPQGDDPSMPFGQVMVQVKARGTRNDPLDAERILGMVFDALHGRTNLPAGGYTIVQINRRISAPLGFDDVDRAVIADQYYADVDYPATVLRPDGGSW